MINAEENFEPIDDETFAEAAMPEIEAMAKAVVEGCVDFSKIRFWEACETAEVAWEETQDQKEVVSSFPIQILDPPPGNRLLANLEQIHKWMESVQNSRKKGMGWVSPYGCPEDGQHAFDSRAKSLKRLE